MANELKTTIIAAGAALIGTALGGVIGYATTQAQISANKQQAIDTFLLSQRQAAFAAFLTDAESFSDDQYSYSAVKGSSKKNLGNMIVADINKLSTGDSTVSVVGPASISSITQEMSTVASVIAYKEGLVATITPQPGESTVQDLAMGYAKDLAKLRTDMANVIKKG